MSESCFVFSDGVENSLRVLALGMLVDAGMSKGYGQKNSRVHLVVTSEP